MSKAAPVRHAFEEAYESVVDALQGADEMYRRVWRFPNRTPVFEAIEQFVQELALVPSWHNELLRRSFLVEGFCARGSKYHIARQQALKSHKDTPRKRCQAKLALNGLRQTHTKHPLFVHAIVDIKMKIEMLLGDPEGNLSPEAETLFKGWRNECRAIQRDAERLNVDGCWYLDQVYQAASSEPSERALCAKAILDSTIGGSQLEGILAAVKSMFAWVRDEGSLPEFAQSLPETFADVGNGISAPPYAIAPKAPKRKPGKERGEIRSDLTIIHFLSKHHDYENGRCLITEPIKVRALAAQADVVPSTVSKFFKDKLKGGHGKYAGGHRKYVNLCSDPKAIDMFLQMLRGERAPEERTYGRNPPGEGGRDDE